MWNVLTLLLRVAQSKRNYSRYVTRSRLDGLLGLHCCIRHFYDQNKNSLSFAHTFTSKSQAYIVTEFPIAGNSISATLTANTNFWSIPSFLLLLLLSPSFRISKLLEPSGFTMWLWSICQSNWLFGWWLVGSEWDKAGFRDGRWRRFGMVECHGWRTVTNVNLRLS